MLVALVPVSLLVALFGGAFGLLMLSNISSQRTANQIFPFVLLPQFFLAGVFNPIHALPTPLAILSALSPLRYAVELTRNVMYGLQPDIPAPDDDVRYRSTRPSWPRCSSCSWSQARSCSSAPSATADPNRRYHAGRAW